jgi:hypothetical protein
LPNVSVFDRPLPQVLEARQHGQHPFELAVEMDLISAELFQLAGVQRLAECLLADQECSRFEEAAQAIGVGSGGRLVLLQLVSVS